MPGASSNCANWRGRGDSLSIAVVRRFPCQEEAAVAVSALWGADIPAFLFDTHFGRLLWTEQYILGGYRVVVPTSLKEEALAILADVEPRQTRTRQRQPVLDVIIVTSAFILGFSGLGIFFAAFLFHARRNERREALGDHDLPASS